MNWEVHYVYLAQINVNIVLGVGRGRWKDWSYIGKSVKCPKTFDQDFSLIKYINDNKSFYTVDKLMFRPDAVCSKRALEKLAFIYVSHVVYVNI